MYPFLESCLHSSGGMRDYYLCQMRSDMELETVETNCSETYVTATNVFKSGDYEGAAMLLAKSLLEEQTSERWNDWATAKFLAGHVIEAEGGYRRALDMNPENVQAVTNLGAVLAGQSRYTEASILLEFALERVTGSEKDNIQQLLGACATGAAGAAQAKLSETAGLWKTLTRGLTLQTVTLDRVLLRLVNLEADLREHMARSASPRQATSVLTDNGLRSQGPDNRRFAAYLGDNLALTRVLDHFKMYVDTRDISLTPHLLMEGNWEMWVTKVFQQLVRPGMTAVDIGANVGYYTMLAAAGVGLKGRVHAVEADPHTFEILEKNVDVNGYGSFVRTHHCAAADKRGELTLFQFRNHHGSNNIFADTSDKRIVGGVKVPAIPLDELILEPVDVMKIDAEGSEPLIFEGMQRLVQRSPGIKILMEFAPQMIERTINPLDFLKRIRAANLECQVVTHDSMIENWPDEKLLEPDIHTVLLTRN
jgi:FkbM family methyltransferase